MSNSEEFVNDGEIRESSKKLKRKFETMKGYEGDERQSYFLRYIDTRPNGDALRKCILEGPYKLTTVTMLTTITILAVLATYDTPAVPDRTAVETLLTMSPENKAHYESENEAYLKLITKGLSI
ncbi:hypothetical protein Tco_0438856 [Tanacetum coccineum]